jgi:hypothetical protein
MDGDWIVKGDACPRCGGVDTEVVDVRHGERQMVKTLGGLVPDIIKGREYTLECRSCGNAQRCEMLGASPFPFPWPPLG